MLLADLFADFLTQICRLSMLLPSAQRGYSFFRYARSVEQKLAVRLDLESRESERLFRVGRGDGWSLAHLEGLREQRRRHPALRRGKAVRRTHRRSSVHKLPQNHAGDAGVAVLRLAEKRCRGECEEKHILGQLQEALHSTLTVESILRIIGN